MSELDELIKANQQVAKANPKPKKQTKQERLMEILTKFHEAYDDLDGLTSEVEDSVSSQEDTNLANTERFQRLQEASETLNEARENIDSALGELDNVEF